MELNDFIAHFAEQFEIVIHQKKQKQVYSLLKPYFTSWMSTRR